MVRYSTCEQGMAQTGQQTEQDYYDPGGDFETARDARNKSYHYDYYTQADQLGLLQLMSEKISCDRWMCDQPHLSGNVRNIIATAFFHNLGALEFITGVDVFNIRSFM